MRSSRAVLVTLALAACTGTRPPPPAPPSSTASVASNLAAFIPAETSYAVFLERAVFDVPGAETWTGALRAAIVREIEEGAEGPPSTEDRFWLEIGRALAPLDDAGLKAAGWWPGRSEAVLYGVGLVPVVRVHADGERLAALVRGAATRTGFRLIEATWQGRPYLVIPSPSEPDEPRLVIATRADQIALAVTRHPEAIAEHLTAFAPLGARSLDAAWPEGGAAHLLLFDPARFAPLLADRKELAHMSAAANPLDDDCTPGIARVFEALPRMTASVAWNARRVTLAVGFDLAAASAGAWRGAGAPAWTADPGDVPTFRLGLGVPPYPVMQQVLPVLEQMAIAGAACEDDGEEPETLGDALAQLAMLQLVQGITVEVAALGGDQITMAVAVATRDVAALWSFIARAMPLLGPTVPAIGEVRDVGALGIPFKVGVGPGMIVTTLGAHAGPRMTQLLAGRPGPREPVTLRMDRAMIEGFQTRRFTFMHQPFGDGGAPLQELPPDMELDSELEGDHLELRLHFMIEH